MKNIVLETIKEHKAKQIAIQEELMEMWKGCEQSEPYDNFCTYVNDYLIFFELSHDNTVLYFAKKEIGYHLGSRFNITGYEVINSLKEFFFKLTGVKLRMLESIHYMRNMQLQQNF
jgi:hypothetical protein